MNNLQNLRSGMEFKNYTEICKFLGEGVKSGKSKTLQLESWGRLFDYDRFGYKFTITKIHVDKRNIKLNKNEKQKLLEGIILHTVLKNDLCGKRAIVNEKQLNTLSKFDLVDKNYISIRNDKDEIKNIINGSQEMIFDIKSAEEKSILEKFEVVMKRLKKKGVLEYENKLSVFTTDGFVEDENDRVELIIHYTVCQGRVMMKYKIDNLYQLYAGLACIGVNKFYEEVGRDMNELAEQSYLNGKLSRKYKILYVTRTYSLYFSDINKCLEAYNDFTLHMNSIGLIEGYSDKFKGIHKVDRIICAKSRTTKAEESDDGLKFRRGEYYQEAVATYLDLLLGE